MKQLAVLFGKIFIFTFIAIALFPGTCLIPVSAYFYYKYFLAKGGDFIFYPMDLWPLFFNPFTLFMLAASTLMALFLGLPHYFMVRAVAHGKPYDLSPRQHRTIELNSPRAIVFDHCTQILRDFPAHIIENNIIEYYLVAHTSAGWKSWGEEIRIDVIGKDEVHTQVKITSRPSLKTTLVDYGKNYENTEKFVALISELPQSG
jgi:hypothetical protein